MRGITSLLLGAVSVAAFAPLGAFPIMWITLAGLFWLLDCGVDEKRSSIYGALIGGSFGLGLFIAGVSWVYVSMSTFGGMPAPIAAIATLLFCTFLSLYPALAGAMFTRFAPTTGWLRGLFFASLWTLGDWLRGWIFTGFPWLSIGYSQTPPSPLAGIAPLFGVFGVSLLTALVAALIGQAFKSLQRKPLKHSATMIPLLIAAALLGGGCFLRSLQWTSAQGEPLSVALLQGNIEQSLKWKPERFRESLQTYYRLALENPAQLTILPETALPVFLDQIPVDYLEEMKRLAARQNGDLLFGSVAGDLTHYTNSAISLGASGKQRYSKSHLVPFGELIPPGFSWFLSLANIPMSAFASGEDIQPPLQIGSQKIAVNICYEDAFGEEIIRALPEATLLVNISNVAWFGDSLAPAQHLQISRMRALETGRMMLRSTNTGMTAIIGADGRLKEALKPFTRAALRGEVQGHAGTTPYVRWGNVPAVVFSLVFLLGALFCRRKAVS